ncbi:MAG: biotin--[acetyl-CoA-carboxylase] ligase, partial [Sedimentibacter sp.]
VTDFESGVVESVIVGIGLNVKTKEEEFPGYLQNIAGSIFHADEKFCIRNQLAAELINNVLSICENLLNKQFLELYKERSMILGEYILYNKNNEWIEVYALDIDEYGGLIIIKKDGQKETLHSGEISVRKLNNINNCQTL